MLKEVDQLISQNLDRDYVLSEYSNDKYQ